MMLPGKTILVTGVASGIWLATAEVSRALGADVVRADVVRVDVRGPAQPVGAVHQADLSHADGVAAFVAKPPRRIDALCNVAGVSGVAGAAKTLAINFSGLCALTEAVLPRLREGGAVVNAALIAGDGLRANLDRAKALVDAAGFPGDIAALLAAAGVGDEIGYPVSKEVLLLWPVRAAHQQAFKSRGIRVNAVSPGPVTTPILTEFRAVPGDARVASEMARRRRCHGGRHRARDLLSVFGSRALDQRGQRAGRRRAPGVDQPARHGLLEQGTATWTSDC